MIVANKMDLPEASNHLPVIQSQFPDKVVVPMAAANNDGVKEFTAALRRFLGL
jgi:50S ribosomal subunit-associated GTPase HflX